MGDPGIGGDEGHCASPAAPPVQVRRPGWDGHAGHPASAPAATPPCQGSPGAYPPEANTHEAARADPALHTRAARCACRAVRPRAARACPCPSVQPPDSVPSSPIPPVPRLHCLYKHVLLLIGPPIWAGSPLRAYGFCRRPGDRLPRSIPEAHCDSGRSDDGTARRATGTEREGPVAPDDATNQALRARRR